MTKLLVQTARLHSRLGRRLIVYRSAAEPATVTERLRRFFFTPAEPESERVIVLTLSLLKALAKRRAAPLNRR